MKQRRCVTPLPDEWMKRRGSSGLDIGRAGQQQVREGGRACLSWERRLEMRRMFSLSAGHALASAQARTMATHAMRVP